MAVDAHLGGTGTALIATNQAGGALVSNFEIFSDSVEIVEFEETQPLSEPLCAPLHAQTGINIDIPRTSFPLEYQKSLLSHLPKVRNVVLAGHSGHGKTSLVKSLARGTHGSSAADLLDCTSHEKARGMTLMARPLNLVTSGSKQSLSLTLIDTPGHANFYDELDAGLGLADCVLLVLDAAEPVMPTARRALEGAVARGRPLIACINKVDRLLVELELTPLQAAQRLQYLVDELKQPNVPVIFASAKYNFSFTRDSVAELYNKYAEQVSMDSAEAFAKYALGPLQKLFQVGLSGEYEVYKQVCTELGIKAKQRLSTEECLATLFEAYFETPIAALVDTLEAAPAPTLEPQSISKVYKHLSIGDQICSLVRSNELLTVGGDITGATIQNIFIPCASYNVPVNIAPPGSIYLVVLDSPTPLGCDLFSPLTVGVEPATAKDRAKLLDRLEVLSLVHNSLQVVTQSTGEIIVSGPGELYLDYVLAEVRETVQIRLTQPSVHFRETLVEPSFRSCKVTTFDGSHTLQVSAAPSTSTNVEFDMPELAVVGALCEEPVQGVKFSLAEPLERPLNAVLKSTLLRGCQGAMLLGKPAMLEPLYRVTAISTRGGPQLYNILRDRRGKILSDEPVPGTALYLLTGVLPCLDSLGFETQAMGHLHGQLRLVLEFDGWQPVPGDALEPSTVPKLQKADNLARDVVLKLRKRKGLSYEPSLKQLVGAEAMDAMGLQE